MRLRRKSKKDRLKDTAGNYLKTAKTAVADAPAPVKALPVVAGVGVAGAVAAKKRRGEPTPA